MRLIIAILLIITTLSSAKAQETTNFTQQRFVHKNMVRFTGTFAFGFKLGEFTHTYLQGNLGYFTSDDVEVRGDIFYLVGTLQDSAAFSVNNQLFFGPMWHIETTTNIDPYIGFQPGIAYARSTRIVLSENKVTTTPVSTDPTFSLVGGVSYYGEKFFHMFAEARYVRGTHLGGGTPVYLDELRISVGLGFNLN